MLPLRLTVREFAILTRQCEETVHRKVRSRQIEGQGRSTLIPRSELLKFDVPLEDAEQAFAQLLQLAVVQNTACRQVA